MKYSVLASGSTGNALYIETDQVRLLVDAGLSGKQLEQHLRSIGVDPKTLTAILISHEHIDHVKGLGVFARRYNIPVYMNEATWSALPSSVGAINEACRNVLESGAVLEIGDLKIETFEVSHDAAEPIGFRFQRGNESLALVTDLGYVSRRIIDRVSGVDALIFESNHDVNMLRMGSYPWNVKRRILSDVGHLSNEDAGEALAEILAGNGEQVSLAHLSQENNLMELAHMTVRQFLEEADLNVGRDVHLWETYPDRPTPLRSVKATGRS
ncbi:Phosphoribosyl 1,2-cyclic phosphodiesterase [Planifilum fulgidum]|jgi:phosphoribosyl 1,2-cyclic phosphodiesterase|uniref:Phosphoribosyl 1,2-cyclic phosphodiesterase n=1 Tax=Planifilum fulgidum TaxID=201973 RepID=A0A1I2LLY5_9BACL|nr:MBL fold metallo-hydrolase [Planifilum fulgidum]MBO2496394.1 MBL fold metallo-hydrolase [Bacillota bacterium]MBO2531316.1 MBL fold metallo-hydrolase [Thermoactinomycetaceae bacterium]SFF78437.1 Phosphoribosyl 1,2-cyclic phosphodiesterase [Planifilum fulgidum]